MKNTTTGGVPILLFDGACNLCNATVRWIIRQDKVGQFRFASLQSAAAHALLASFGLPSGDRGTVVLVYGNKVYRYSSAVLHVGGLLGWPWKFLYGFFLVPKIIRDAVYRLVARYRLKVFGATPVCWVMRPEWRTRFLDA